MRRDLISMSNDLLSPTAISNLLTMGIVAKADPRRAIPVTGYTIPELDTRKLRAKLILEKALETISGLGIQLRLSNVSLTGYEPADDINNYSFDVSAGPPDFEKIIDGCCDLNYVSTGTLMACGVPDVPHQEAVNEANELKFPNGIPILRADGKFQKPEGWQAPKHLGDDIGIGVNNNLFGGRAICRRMSDAMLINRFGK